jgi:hypothetical protein
MFIFTNDHFTLVLCEFAYNFNYRHNSHIRNRQDIMLLNGNAAAYTIDNSSNGRQHVHKSMYVNNFICSR